MPFLGICSQHGVGSECLLFSRLLLLAQIQEFDNTPRLASSRYMVSECQDAIQDRQSRNDPASHVRAEQSLAPQCRHGTLLLSESFVLVERTRKQPCCHRSM